MPVYNTKEDITAALERFNKRLHNAAYSFKVDNITSTYIAIQASFDFAYYVNVTIYFNNVIYTSLKERDSWPDAWHADQIFLLTDDEITSVLDWNEVEYTSTEGLFGLLFNIAGRQEYHTGVTVCKSLEIHWQHPAFED